MAPAREEAPELSFEYGCDAGRLPRALADRFVESRRDEHTERFVERALSARHGRFVWTLHAALRPFLSDFDVNGLLGTYPMFLLGEDGWRRLLDPVPGARLLDVGAGNGDVTALLAPLFGEVTTSETSFAMTRRLRARGYRCLRRDLALGELPAERFDVISCLNVIDRSARPRTLLERLTTLVAPGGRLVLATPLPFDPFVYDAGRSLPPEERLEIASERWEEALTELSEHELRRLGLEVVAFTRAPYLSGGDRHRPLYVLDDAVVVCERASR